LVCVAVNQQLASSGSQQSEKYVGLGFSNATQISVESFLVLLVNDSEYNNFTGTQPIPCRWCIYFVSPGARCCAPTHPAPPPFCGGRKYKKKRKSPVASALALGHVVGVGVGEVGVGEVAACWER
jgi:hypothetical protein